MLGVMYFLTLLSLSAALYQWAGSRILRQRLLMAKAENERLAEQLAEAQTMRNIDGRLLRETAILATRNKALEQALLGNVYGTIQVKFFGRN